MPLEGAEIENHRITLRGMPDRRTGMVTIEPKAGSHRPRWRLRTIAVLTAIAVIFAIGGEASATLLAQPNSGPQQHTSTVSSAIKFSPATQAELRKLESTPQGRAALVRAFQVSFGRTAEVAATPVGDSSQIRLDATCAPSFSCGISSSGGWHFWIIASYAAAESADLAALQPYCWAALVPLTGAVGAAACLGVGAILWELVNNWPRMTNHGVWLAVYWWGIQDGRY
jgi:hypothetical protein